MNSIFDIFKDYYGIYNDRPGPQNSSVSYKLPVRFIKQRIRKDLTIEQKMIVFQFMINLDNSIDVEPINNLTL
jgi:hypothetical protein